MAAKSPFVSLTNGTVLKIFRRPEERRRRRKSAGALLSDFLSLRKAILLCPSCEYRMGKTWTRTYGYRTLHNMHTDGACDACQTYASCNLYHHVEEEYARQWTQVDTVLEAAKRQTIELRDKRRIRALE